MSDIYQSLSDVLEGYILLFSDILKLKPEATGIIKHCASIFRLQGWNLYPEEDSSLGPMYRTIWRRIIGGKYVQIQC